MTDPIDTYSREGLLKVIDSLPLAISVIDRNRTVALANKTTTRFVNKNEADLLGSVGEAFGCIHHDDVPEGCGFGQDCVRCKLRQAVQDTMDNKRPNEMVETTMVFKGHGERHLRITTQPLVLNNEETVLLSIEDITQAKASEKAQMEQERLSAAVKTAGAICHEVNQPLMIILGMAEILLEDIGENDAPNKPDLLEIKKQAERLGKVTRKLITLTDFHTKPYMKNEILDLDKSSAP